MDLKAYGQIADDNKLKNSVAYKTIEKSIADAAKNGQRTFTIPAERGGDDFDKSLKLISKENKGFSFSYTNYCHSVKISY